MNSGENIMPSVTTRRDFLKNASFAAGAGLVTGLSLTGENTSVEAAELNNNLESQKAIPVVDTHQHLWDLSKFNLPWLKNDAVQAINRNFVMSDYLKATKGANVVKTVYMEVNVHPSQQAKEAEYVIDLCKRDDNPMRGAVIGGYPHEKNFAKYAERFGKNKYIKGFRTVLHDPDRPKGLCLQPRFVENMKLLGEMGLSFDLCMRPDEILDGVKLAEKCPNTRFVIDHCGNMSVTSTDKKVREKWEKGIKEAAALKNTVCKISGIVVTARKGTWKPSDLAPNMNFCMDAFGEDRAYFGGDWPVCTLRATFVQWVDALKWIVRNRSAKFQRKLFHDNAVKFYRLG
ncbi:MAG: amidohydrolase [Planctomycetaceae bacterium]